MLRFLSLLLVTAFLSSCSSRKEEDPKEVEARLKKNQPKAMKNFLGYMECRECGPPQTDGSAPPCWFYRILTKSNPEDRREALIVVRTDGNDSRIKTYKAQGRLDKKGLVIFMPLEGPGSVELFRVEREGTFHMLHFRGIRSKTDLDKVVCKRRGYRFRESG